MPNEYDFGGKTLKNATLDVSVNGPKILSDVVGDINYIGSAPYGSATSADVWTIRRTTYNSAGFVVATAISATNVKWDDRLTTSYS